MKIFSIPRATSPLRYWLYYLEHLQNQNIEPGLKRVKKVAKRLDLLKTARTIFTVAGTNGKGTTCSILEGVLLAAGYRVGVYSSPHLLRYTERVRIQGKELKEADHSYSFAILEKGRSDISLTYFEYSTLSALYLFQQSDLDVIILEVGIGGRLDATNIIDPSVAIVTSIALDHTALLGFDRESIGREKAGIFRAGIPAIIGDPDMPDTMRKVATEKGATLYRRRIEWDFSTNNQEWIWHSACTTWSHLPLPQVPLPNAATALAALNYSNINIDEKAIIHGLVSTFLPGRFQVINTEPLLILDVAHNPDAAKYLAGRLREFINNRLNKKIQPGCLRAVVSMLASKDVSGMIEYMKPLIHYWYCAPLKEPYGASIELLTKYLDKPNIFKNVKKAWIEAMKDATPQDIIIVYGSFQTVASVMEALNKEDASDK
ncbi:bifunctional tetrahydrofolate synthase/dihydrofolate synthase [Candidatus Profftia tarda]|nr:bifunctional tetrahydrofolate synthase/dihydrofolate synthase [Candidatus Profftia tarda]